MAACIQRISLSRRRAIFAALVELQDHIAAPNVAKQVRASKDDICEQFGITEQSLDTIVNQGIDAVWPPLEP